MHLYLLIHFNILLYLRDVFIHLPANGSTPRDVKPKDNYGLNEKR